MPFHSPENSQKGPSIFQVPENAQKGLFRAPETAKKFERFFMGNVLVISILFYTILLKLYATPQYSFDAFLLNPLFPLMYFFSIILCISFYGYHTIDFVLWYCTIHFILKIEYNTFHFKNNI